jgi:hypothetical protein
VPRPPGQGIAPTFHGLSTSFPVLAPVLIYLSRTGSIA